MEKITVNKFRSNLSQYMLAMRTGAILEIGGHKYCAYTGDEGFVEPVKEVGTTVNTPFSGVGGNVGKPSIQDLQDLVKKMENKFPVEVVNGVEKVVQERKLDTSEWGSCSKCGYSFEDVMEWEEDGEEYFLCEGCCLKGRIKFKKK